MPATRRACALLLAGGLLLGGGVAATARAEGASLNGLVAPELTFPGGVGVERGTTLSSFRGKVVWLKFWLRDCPRCRKTLPDAQRLHELYGNSGLVVLTVVHQYGPDQVKPFLDNPPPPAAGQPKPGPYTFRVASDPSGALAQAYQVNHRPTDYLIGVNGRVRISNGWDEETIRLELAEFRKHELGPVPTGLPGVLQAVQSGELGNYGEALRLAQAAAARPEASAEVRDFAKRLEPLARRKLEEALAVARVRWNRQELAAARDGYEGLAKAYAETPLAARAKDARDAFVTATTKGP